MNVVSYGGGTNSTAMLIGMWERGIPADLILFADTGGEKPHTYAHLELMHVWSVKHLGCGICVVKSPTKTLEQDCLDRNALPSVAYGFKTCSQRWKAQPQEVFLNNWLPSIRHKEQGGEIVKLIGFDADEPQRAKLYPGNRYPLIEWGWGRDECIEAIDRAGLTRPGKSACFFCPSSKAHEILNLPKDLQDRAIAMEKNAQLTTVKGLGRNFAWADLIRADRAQIDMFKSNIEIDCGCYDGAEA